jgi:hypothetical protein
MGVELLGWLIVVTAFTGILALGCLLDPWLKRWFDDY